MSTRWQCGASRALVGTALTTGTASTTLLALVGQLAERKLLLELAAERKVHLHQRLARLAKGVLGRDGAVRLDADHDLRHVGVSDWDKVSCCPGFSSAFDLWEELTLVRRQKDVRRLLEVLGKQVAEGVVLLEEDEVRGIGQAWREVNNFACDCKGGRGGLTGEDLLRDLLLSILEKEELESWDQKVSRPLETAPHAPCAPAHVLPRIVAKSRVHLGRLLAKLVGHREGRDVMVVVVFLVEEFCLGRVRLGGSRKKQNLVARSQKY